MWAGILAFGYWDHVPKSEDGMTSFLEPASVGEAVRSAQNPSGGPCTRGEPPGQNPLCSDLPGLGF
jgi:hypothetical protein